ncbi:hypothetical protein [Kutzneria sp. NPDC051319]|uniref:hypothetical protein n=1 Tax=Kutzneria sp. NPDC051319 TaxID=3155047 RepID=UPI003443E5B6
MTEVRRATVCRVCGGELWDVVGRGVHPLCTDERELWWTAADIGAAVRVVARRAEARKPLPASKTDPPNKAVDAVCALLVGDPSNRDSLEAVVSAVLRSAADDVFWRTTANTMRPYIPKSTNPAVVGATVKSLIGLGLLSDTGRYVECDDRTAGNHGKPQRVYEMNADLLEHMVFGEDQ